MEPTTVRSSGVAPERSYDQRMLALRRANAIRSMRAELKRDAKAGRVDLLEVLAAPLAEVETMKVFDLLLATPKFGRVKVNKILASAKVSPSKTVGGMTDRQRQEVLKLARPRRSATRRRPAEPPRLYSRCRECSARLLVPTAEGLCGLCRLEGD